MNLPDKNENYKDVNYWNGRYENEESYEWCKDYSTFQQLIHKSVQKNSKILIIGCGNSRLSLDLYNDGFHSITNIDYSPVVIAKLNEKYGHLMTYVVMDMRSISFPDQVFDVVIEKGTLDVLFTEEKSMWNISPETQKDMDDTLSSISNVLSTNDGSVFISITFAEPFFRRQHYSKYWSSVNVETFGDFFHYYFYVCKN